MSSPDFRTWAENIINMARQFGTAQDEIERALKQSYEQGVSLGYHKGSTDTLHNMKNISNVSDVGPLKHWSE